MSIQSRSYRAPYFLNIETTASKRVLAGPAVLVAEGVWTG